jgi:drug/metabolite transporter (DMT)-like permease
VVFWIVTGSIGFGAFYALICFSADYSPGWIIAATWQFTLVASLLVLMVFGRRFPSHVWLFSAMIFFGVLLINLSHATEISIEQILFGALPVLLSAFCYPLGNQLVWEVRQGQHKKSPKIHSPLLDKAFNKVLLGSIPMWVVFFGGGSPVCRRIVRY